MNKTEILNALTRAANVGDMEQVKKLTEQLKNHVDAAPGQRTNKWVDDGTLFQEESVKLHPDAPGLAPSVRTPRTRSDFVPMDVTCTKCGRLFKNVSPTVVMQSTERNGGGFRCSKCLAKRG